MTPLSILLFFVGSNCVQIAHDSTAHGPDGCTYTQAVHGAQAEAMNQRMAFITYDGTTLRDDGAPVAISTPEIRVEATELVLRSHTNQYGIGLAVLDDGDLITYTVHQSPRPSDEVLAGRIETARLERVALRQDVRGVRGSMATNITETQAIVVAPTSTTTQVRSGFIDLRRELIDTQQEVRRLAAIVAALVKYKSP